jgi:putative hydrolase
LSSIPEGIGFLGSDTAERYGGYVDPVAALQEIAELLAYQRDAGFRARAFTNAARAIADASVDDLQRIAAAGQLAAIPGVGDKTASVIAEALTGVVPSYLLKLRAESRADVATDAGRALQRALRGDLHLHSDWSDGGDTIHAMAAAAREIGHEYLALTDHSPRLKVANGLDAQRLSAQLDAVAEINREFAPFRMLTGVETDILDDGALDGEPELLSRIDVVIASVHSKLRMERQPMTERMILAMANPLADILGHCTGRLVTGRGRPESEFDADMVFASCLHFDKAVEINCRPERLDPPKRMLRRVVELGIKVSIDTDAHATHQLQWHPYGCNRAAECGVPVESIVNTWPVEELLAWCGRHEGR